MYTVMMFDTITIASSDNTQSWRRPDEGRIQSIEFADMQRSGLSFAREFYSAAFWQMTS